MLHLLWNVIILGVAVFLVAELLPGISLRGFGTAIVVALVYSLISFLFGWVLLLLALPAVIITFGLFKFVINAFLLWITDKLVDGIEIKGLVALLISAVLITITDSLLRVIF